MRFSFYMVDAGYCDYLRTQDPCVPYTMDRKSIRPFVGIVFSVNGFHYYAPLTSPKVKHLKMKNQIDFLKINHGTWGAINFNNMIPVHPNSLKKVEMKIFETDSAQDIAYKNLLFNQLSWCNSNRETIISQAQKLYQLIVGGKAWGNLSTRCCNFSLDEMLCLAYCKEKFPDDKSLSVVQDTDMKPSIRDALRKAKEKTASTEVNLHLEQTPKRDER